MKDEFKDTVEDLISLMFSYEHPAKELGNSFSRKIIYEVFCDTRMELEDYISSLKDRLQHRMEYYQEEIAEELSQRYSKNYWMKVEDGWDVLEGDRMVAYSKNKDEYLIVKIKPDLIKGEGFVCVSNQGNVVDVDYVGFLPLAPKKKDRECA